MSAKLRNILLIWTGLSFLPAWLVTIRGLFDGDDYAWGVTERIRGRGAGGYYFLAPLTAFYGLALLALGWRGALRPFHIMLAIWHVPLGVIASVAALRNRDMLRLQGDTLGIDISLAKVAPVLFGSVAAGTLVLAVADQPEQQIPAWTTQNRRLLGLALSLVPLQFILLRSGKHHGPTDKIGVVLTIGQWLVINVGLAIRKR